MSESINSYIPLIVEKLKTLQPYKIILFGSYAYGHPDAESDVDLLVVLNSDETPQSFRENIANKLLVRNILWDLNRKISIDLIVHTKPMYQKFNAMGSMFSKEIAQQGKVLYEADNS